MMGGFYMGQNNIADMFNTDPAGSHLYTHLLREAAYGERDVLTSGGVVHLHKGQLVFGIHAWVVKTGLTEKVIRGRLSALEKVGEVVKQNFSKYSVISITSLLEGQGNVKQTSSKQPANGHITNTEDGKKKINTPPSGDGIAAEKGKPASKGSRWIEGTALPGDWLDWAKENTNHTEIGIRAQFERFSDYWIAQPGQKGIKADWKATWRNWMRSPHNQSAHQPTRAATPRAFAQ